MLSKFHASFFSKTYVRENLGPRLLRLFELKDSGEALCCRLSDQRSLSYKIVVANVPVIILLVKVQTLRTHSVKATF